MLPPASTRARARAHARALPLAAPQHMASVVLELQEPLALPADAGHSTTAVAHTEVLVTRITSGGKVQRTAYEIGARSLQQVAVLTSTELGHSGAAVQGSITPSASADQVGHSIPGERLSASEAAAKATVQLSYQHTGGHAAVAGTAGSAAAQQPTDAAPPAELAGLIIVEEGDADTDSDASSYDSEDESEM